jgi:hypothetical protein
MTRQVHDHISTACSGDNEYTAHMLYARKDQEKADWDYIYVVKVPTGYQQYTPSLVIGGHYKIEEHFIGEVKPKLKDFKELLK